MLKPEEIPMRFSQPTIEVAISAWMMGTMMFPGPHDQALGQMFAILIGQRIRLERDGLKPDSAHMITLFVEDLEGQVPSDLRSQFTELDPKAFDEQYQALLNVARQNNVDPLEFAFALRQISAVTRYFSTRLRGTGNHASKPAFESIFVAQKGPVLPQQAAISPSRRRPCPSPISRRNLRHFTKVLVLEYPQIPRGYSTKLDLWLLELRW